MVAAVNLYYTDMLLYAVYTMDITAVIVDERRDGPRRLCDDDDECTPTGFCSRTERKGKGDASGSILCIWRGKRF